MNEGNLLDPLMRTKVSCNLQICLGAGHARSLTSDLPTQITTNGPAYPIQLRSLTPTLRLSNGKLTGNNMVYKPKKIELHIFIYPFMIEIIALRMEMAFMAQT